MTRRDAAGQQRDRLRILFITRKWPPAMGGMEVFSVEIASELESLADTDVLALPGRSDGHPPGALALISFGLKSAWQTLFRRKRYDGILLGDVALSPLAIWLRLTLYRGTILVTAHGMDIAFTGFPGLVARAYRAMVQLVARSRTVSHVAANSGATAILCRDIGFRRVSVIPLGVRAAPLDVAPSETTRDLLFTGRVEPRKGVSWFILNVLPHLPKDIGLRIAGVVWDDHEQETIDLADRVSLIGSLDKDALRRERQRALAVVMPNRRVSPLAFEGFGLVAIEAAADGGLLLASALDGITDAVLDGETGFLLQPELRDAWISKITEISDWKPEDRARFVTQAARTAQSRFTWGATAEAYLALIAKDPSGT